MYVLLNTLHAYYVPEHTNHEYCKTIASQVVSIQKKMEHRAKKIE